MEQIKVLRDVKTIKPRMYKVILLNDDYTTFDFVIFILKTIFYKSEEEAINLTLKIDREGSAIVGIYPKEVAEMKISKTISLARENGFPLQAIMEEM